MSREWKWRRGWGETPRFFLRAEVEKHVRKVIPIIIGVLVSIPNTRNLKELEIRVKINDYNPQIIEACKSTVKNTGFCIEI